MRRAVVSAAVGIDPGLRRSGIAHCERAGDTFIATRIEARVLKGKTLAAEMGKAAAELFRVVMASLAGVTATTPVAVEAFTHPRSASSAAKLAAAHAAIAIAVTEELGQSRLVLLGSQHVKRVLVGSPSAGKRAVRSAVEMRVREAAFRMVAMLAEEKEHAADAVAVAVVQLGIPPARPLFVGGLMGSVLFEFFAEVAGRSIVDAVDPSLFTLGHKATPAVAVSMAGWMPGRCVVFVGQAMAASFGFGGTPALEVRDFKLPGQASAYAAAVYLPHPVTEKKWWSVTKNKAAARRFLRAHSVQSHGKKEAE